MAAPENRPIVPVPRTIVDWALEVLALASLVSLLGLVAGYWTQLPERIPTHFGASGRPDGWGGRSMLLLLPLVTLVMYGTLTLVGQFPQHFNYTWRITPENALAQYRAARRLLSSLKLILVSMFTWVAWVTIRAALGGEASLGGSFFPLVFGSISGVLVAYLYLSSRLR